MTVSDLPVAAKAAPKAIVGLFRRGRVFLQGAAAHKSLRAWAQPCTYLGAAMLVSTYFALVYLLIADRTHAYREAQTHASNLVRVTGYSFSDIFKGADANLLSLRKSYRQSPSAFDLSAWAQEPSVKNELTFDFAIIDANGRTTDSSLSKTVIGADRGQRPYFRAQANATADELLISEPITLDATGKHAILLSRRLTAPDGTFAGVAVALIDTNKLGEIARGIDLGWGGTFALVGRDGIIRARVVDGKTDPGAIGRKLPSTAGLLDHAAQAATGAFWNTPPIFDNVSRLISYRAIDPFPLFALVTLSEAEVYRLANENARIYWAISLTLSVIILMAIVVGARRERRLIATAEALTQSQERYARVEEAVTDGIWDWNILTGGTYISPRWKRILGYADDELPNALESFFDRIHPDDKAAVVEANRAQLEDNKPYSLDFRLRRKNGSYCWVNSRGQAVRDATGRPVRMLGITTDIDARKRTESEISESRDNLANAEAMALLGYFKFELGSPAFQWSEGLYRIAGKSPESFTPTFSAIAELMHPEDRAALEQSRRQVTSGAEVSGLTLRMVMDDGQIKYVEGWSKPTRDASGAVVGMFGTLQDVTARKRAEALIEESNRNLARAEEISRIGHYKYDRKSDEYTWSDGIYRILGQSPASFKPTLSGVLNLVHPDDLPAVEQYRRDVMAGVEVSRLEMRMVKDDGQVIHVNAWSTPIRDSDGAITGMFGTLQDITEQKLAEAAFTESHHNLQRAEAMAQLGHYKFEAETETMTWSEGTYRIFGQSPASFIPTLSASLQFYHPDDRAALMQFRRDLMAGREPPPVTLRLIMNGGRTKDVELWSAPIRDDKGAVTGMFGTIQDVTERKHAETLIEETRDNLARAEKMARLGHIKFEQKSGEYTWSEGAYQIMGKSSATYKPTQETSLELVHPEDRPALTRYRSNIMAGRELPPLTVRAVKDDGSITHMEIWSQPLHDNSGAVTGMFGTVQDVTERQRAETALKQSRDNLARAEAIALLGHTSLDLASGAYIWSEGVYRIMQKSPASFIPTPENSLALIHPEDRPAHEKYRCDVIAGGENPPATRRVILDDGQTRYVEFWSVPIHDTNGAVTGKFSTLQDVTARKRTEAVLAQINNDLEKRVSERTAELAAEMRRREEAQMTLGQMQKMEAIGQLTAGIAHDFNNLLAVIGGGLEFVNQAAARGLTADPELIDAALRATRRGSELVRRLLAFSRQSPLRPEPTAINQLVLDTLRLLQRTLGQGIDMVTHLNAEAALITVDRNQMANALLNLTLNARDAMPEGGQLTIATDIRPSRATGGKPSARSPTGQDICITISDTGTGMTDEVREHAFEPFFTTKPDGLGSGLGLSMVQGFVEQSGGQVDIDSQPGRGSTITIRLPRAAETGAADDLELSASTAGTMRNKTVLLVEDDPDVRVITAAQLKNLGYKVHAVANGMEAIDLIASPANIDITLTDIVLPGGFDGIELIKEAMRARPSMGVLCMSGYDPTQKHSKWLQMQNINFLQKPFSSSRLAQALDAATAH